MPKVAPRLRLRLVLRNPGGVRWDEAWALALNLELGHGDPRHIHKLASTTERSAKKIPLRRTVR